MHQALRVISRINPGSPLTEIRGVDSRHCGAGGLQSIAASAAPHSARNSDRRHPGNPVRLVPEGALLSWPSFCGAGIQRRPGRGRASQHSPSGAYSGRSRVNSQNGTIPANLYPFCCGGAAGRSGPRTTILHNETAHSKRFSCRPPGYVQAGLPGLF